MVHDAVPCSMCQGPLDERTFVVCSRCEVPVHADCWNAIARCPVFACGSVQWYGAGEYLYRRSGFDTRERIDPPRAREGVTTGASRAQLEARLKDLEDRWHAARTRVRPHFVASWLMIASGFALCTVGMVGVFTAAAGGVYMLATQLIVAPEEGPLEHEVYALRRWIKECVARARAARTEQKRSAVSRGLDDRGSDLGVGERTR